MRDQTSINGVPFYDPWLDIPGHEAWSDQYHNQGEFFLPAYGYWYTNVNPTDLSDPANWDPVDFTNNFPGTPNLFRGLHGSAPKGGVYFAAGLPQSLPSIPHVGDDTLHSVLLCVDAATCTELWRHDFGQQKTLGTRCPAVGLMQGGLLYVLLGGTVYKIQPSDGTILGMQAIPGASLWLHADMIPKDGGLVVAGDGGMFAVI